MCFILSYCPGFPRIGAIVAIVLSAVAFLMLFLFAAYAGYARLLRIKEGTILRNSHDWDKNYSGFSCIAIALMMTYHAVMF